MERLRKLSTFMAVLLTATVHGQTIVTRDIVDSVWAPHSLSLGADGKPLVAVYNRHENRVQVIRILSGGIDTETWTHTFSSSGAWMAMGVDQTGRASLVFTDAATQEVDYRGWCPEPHEVSLITTIDGSNNPGQHSSIAISPGGSLGVAYTNADLKETRFASGGGGSWIPQVLFVSSGAPNVPSLSFDHAARPGVAMTETGRTEVFFSGPQAVPAAATVSTIDATGGAGPYSSLSLNPTGGLEVAYSVQDLKAINFARKLHANWETYTIGTYASSPTWSSLAADASGRQLVVSTNPATGELWAIGWLQPPVEASRSVIDQNGIAGPYSALVYREGFGVAVGYTVQDTRESRYAWWNGSAWLVSTLYQAAGGSPTWVSLGIDAARRPSVVFNDAGRSEAFYAGWLAAPLVALPEVVDAQTATVGQNPSLTLSVNGKPLVSYADAANQDLRFAYRAAGTWLPQVVDSAGSVGAASAIGQGPDGYVGIVYSDATRTEVKYANAFVMPEETTIRGRLVDGGTNAPIVGALVSVVELGARAVTGGMGQFILNTPPASGYTLESSAAGYLPARIHASLVGQHVDVGSIRVQRFSETEFDLVELRPNPNPAVSTVEEGGVFHRYYWLVGRQHRLATNGVPVMFEREDGQSAATFISSNFEGIDGVVRVTYPAADVGCLDCTVQFRLKQIGGRSILSPVSFLASVGPRRYATIFEVERNVDIDVGIAVGAHGSVGVGDKTMARLELQKCGAGAGVPDSIRIEEEFLSKAGVSVGVGAGVRIGAGTNLGAYAGASAGLSVAVRGEGEYRYGYDTPADRAQTRAKMFDLSRAVLSLASHPLLSRAVLVLLTDADVEECQWNHLEAAEAGIGFVGEGSANVLAGLFTPRKIGIGVGASLSSGFELSALVNIGYRPGIQKTYGSLALSGEVSVGGGAGVMLWKYERSGRPRTRDLNAIKERSGWGVTFEEAAHGSVEIGAGWNRDSRPTIDFRMTKGVTEWEREYALSFSTEYIEQYAAGGALRALYSIGNEAEEAMPLPSIQDGFVNKAMDGVLTAVMERQLFGDVPPIVYTVDSARTTLSRGFSLDVDWAIAAKIKLDDVGVEWKTSHKAVKERGVFSGFTGYPLEEYPSIPEVSTPISDALVKIFADGFNTYGLADLVRSVSLVFGGTNSGKSDRAASVAESVTMELSTLGSTLELDPASIPPTLDTLSCQTWNWYGSSPHAVASDLPAKYRQVAQAIKRQQQEIARLDYGIGGFYKFTPQAVPLSSPAVLTIVYPDSDVVGMDETALAIFQQDTTSVRWRYVGGIVNPDSNRLTVSVDTLQLYTIAPIMPDGLIGLHRDRDTLANDSLSAAFIMSDTLRLSNGGHVGTGTPYTVSAENVTVVEADQDTGRIGIQLTSVDSRILFHVRSLHSAGKARVRVESVYGTAAGEVEMIVIDTVKPVVPAILGVRRGDGEIRLIVASPDSARIMQYEIHFDRTPGPPYAGVALGGGEDSPVTVSAEDTIAVSRLKNDSVYYFAVRSIDASGNRSDYSNEVSGAPLDTVAPGRILSMDFSVVDSTFLARWYASGDNGTEGRAAQYVAKVSNQLLVDTVSWWSAATSLGDLGVPNEAGAPDYHLLHGVSVDSSTLLAIQVEDEVGLRSPVAFFQVRENRATRTLSLRKGWNLVSAPIVPSADSSPLFPLLAAGPYSYKPGNGYTSVDTVRILAGYWAKLGDTYQKDFHGTIIGDTVIPVVEGWNMIGSNSGITPVENITSEPSGMILSPFYEYTGSGYAITSHLGFGNGYWVKVSHAGSVVLSPTGVGKLDARQSPLMRFTLVTAENRTRSLWVVEDGQTGYYEAPPLGPDGMFDARFAGDRYAESEEQSSYEVVLHNAVYPVTLSVSGMGAEEFDVLGSVSGVTYGRLGEGSRVEVTNAKDDKVSVVRVTVPKVYYLAQNYPNPFNPLTVIGFGLPEQQTVSLKVFDVLGREVATLLDGVRMEAGNHKVEWSAVKHATGVYFVRMTAGSYSNLKKMIFLK